jgi:hypothetical protein
MAREGTTQYFALRKGVQNNMWPQKCGSFINVNTSDVLIKINFLHPVLWRPISNVGDGDTLYSLPRTCERHKSGPIKLSDF